MFKHVKYIVAVSIVTLAMSSWAADQAQQSKTAAPQAADSTSKQTTKDAGTQSSTSASTSEKKEEKSSLTAGYRRVMRGGIEYFCKRDVATGSRLRREETCRTKEQLELANENLEDQIRKSQTSADDGRK